MDFGTPCPPKTPWQMSLGTPCPPWTPCKMGLGTLQPLRTSINGFGELVSPQDLWGLGIPQPPRTPG